MKIEEVQLLLRLSLALRICARIWARVSIRNVLRSRGVTAPVVILLNWFLGEVVVQRLEAVQQWSSAYVLWVSSGSGGRVLVLGGIVKSRLLHILSQSVLRWVPLPRRRVLILSMQAVMVLRISQGSCWCCKRFQEAVVYGSLLAICSDILLLISSTGYRASSQGVTLISCKVWSSIGGCTDHPNPATPETTWGDSDIRGNEDYEFELAERAGDMGRVKLARSCLNWKLLFESMSVIETCMPGSG
ncbi:hypothetical protein DY000_02039252 [Brassica cretica]|uniref:Uncharacterized protein n=1 Tax=Brassica cretica TaxID=69181 RepID=A0ABQ7BPT8_BRACR|nr:hypothetical protein DY000_02039252 [Brassica cretica]